MKVLKGFRVLWLRWKFVAHKIGDFQARLILSIFYFLILAPFALGVKFLSDPLQLKSRKGWLDRVNLEEGPEKAKDLARKQF